jgi:hypothetical protein
MQAVNNNTTFNYNNADINSKVSHDRKISNQLPILQLSPTIDLKTVNISHIPFNIEEYKLIMHFKNGGDITSLSDKQLTILSKLYIFSQEDFIALDSRYSFLTQLQHQRKIDFCRSPEMIKKMPLTCLQIFNSGDYSFIQYISKDDQTQQMCDLAFNYYSGFFEYFNDKFKNIKMCINYIKNSCNIDISLIPKKLRTNKQLYECIIARIKNEANNLVEGNKVNQKNIRGIELLPTKILKENPELILVACIVDTSAIAKFLPELITEEIIINLVTVLIDDTSIKYLDINSPLAQIKQFYYSEKESISLIGRYFEKYNSKLQQLIEKKLDISNKQVPSSQKTTVNYKNSLDYRDLEENLKADEQIIINLLKDNIRNIYFVDSKHLTKKICQEVFNNLPIERSTTCGRIEYRKIIENKCDFILEIPIDFRTVEMWFYLCTRRDRGYISEIPEKIFTKKLLVKFIDEYIQWNNSFDIKFLEILFALKFFDDNMKAKILANSLQVASRFSTVVFAILKSTKIPNAFKNDFLQHITTGNFYFPVVKPKELYSRINPLQSAISAPFVTELLSSCYKFNNPYKFNLSDVAQELDAYIQNSKQKTLPINNAIEVFAGAEVRGGRTIQVNISASIAKFYKFRKSNESLESFTAEAYFLEFLEKTENGRRLKQQLKSDIPIINKLVSMPITQLPRCAFHCEDEPEVYTNSQGVKCADVIVFSCSKDYLEYAHKKDINNPQNIFFKPEQGLLNACHDLGVFMSYGIYYTNTLPAYHLGKYDRNWTALHMLLRRLSCKPIRSFFDLNERNDFNMVGKMESWDSTATERPDYGYTGLRDFGDFELFGNISSTLERAGCQQLKLFSNITQKILAANTVSECLLAAILLYARLHKQSSNYHYKNIEAKKNMADFIESIFSNFLLGITQGKTSNIQEFMELSSADYTQWLERTVTEILYWTASQPTVEEVKEANIKFNDTQTNITDCFSTHINQGKLPSKLYDEINIDKNIKYPKQFTNLVGEKLYNHLGMTNGTFPLLALLNFLFLFNSRINKNNL